VTGRTHQNPRLPLGSRPIAQFYKQVELRFAEEWRRYTDLAKTGEYAPGSPPAFWKGIGDEAVYVKEITTHREAYCCIHCWMNAINSHRQELRRKYPKLDLKSIARIAGFHVNNPEIILRTNVTTAEEDTGGMDSVYDNVKLMKKYHSGDKHNLVRDFVGPSIDIGFRLSSFATPRKLVVSLDLALILAAAEGYRPHDFWFAPMKFFFDGSTSMKGVLGGVPYPIIWIDLLTTDKLEQAEDKLLRRESVAAAALVTYCEEFISKHYPRIIRPYIGESIDQRFSTVPEEHKQRVYALRTYINNEAIREPELENSEEKQNQAGQDMPEGELVTLVGALVKGTRQSADIEVGTSLAPPPPGQERERQLNLPALLLFRLSIEPDRRDEAAFTVAGGKIIPKKSCPCGHTLARNQRRGLQLDPS
jgi:hypothetical protein